MSVGWGEHEVCLELRYEYIGQPMVYSQVLQPVGYEMSTVEVFLLK